MNEGIFHIPGYGMVYDPDFIKIEGDKVYRKQDGQWQELQGFERPQQSSPYAQGAMSAGTLGAGQPFQWPAMHQMAQQNQLPQILSIVNALGPNSAQPFSRQQVPQYQNPYVNQLLRYI